MHRGWLAARIAALLGHYYEIDADELTNKAIAQDWIGALCHLPQWALEAACLDWLTTEQRKPTPAGIRELATRRMAPVDEAARYIDEARARSTDPDRWEPPSPEEKARVQALLDGIIDPNDAELAAKRKATAEALRRTQCDRGAAIMQSDLSRKEI